MIGFNSKNSKVKNLLRASKQDFAFDSESVRARVMIAANARHFSIEDKRRLTLNPKTWPKYALGAGIAGVVLAATTGLAFASNQAKPGEMLFPIQKLQDKIVLSLPLPQTQKAEFSTKIVAKRLENLSDVAKNPNANPDRLAAEIKEAQTSITQAAAFIQTPVQTADNSSSNKNSISDKNAKTLDTIADQLDDLATRHQTQLQNLSDSVKDEDLKNEISQSVEKISETRAKFLENRKKHTEHQESIETQDK